MDKGILYYTDLYKKIDTGTATPEEIEEEKVAMEEAVKQAPQLFQELVEKVAHNSKFRHFIIGMFCLYRTCEKWDCIDMLVDGVQKVGFIIAKSYDNHR